MPLYFIENDGQVEARVSYYLVADHKSVFFTSRSVTLVFHLVAFVVLLGLAALIMLRQRTAARST